MAITYTETFTTQTGATGGDITSSSVTVANNDIVVVMFAVEDNVGAGSLTISNTGTAFTWNNIATTNTNSNSKVAAWWAKASTGQSMTVSVAGDGASASVSCISIAIHTGAHQTTPVPAGKVYSGTGGNDVTQSITPTASGSALWMVAADWGANNAMSAATDCTVESVDHQAGKYTAAIVRPTTQPRTDANAFTIGFASDATTETVAWIAFEVQAAPVVATAALTGTATSTINETDIVAGGKTVILTLTDATWVPTTGTPTFSTATTAGTTSGDGRTGDGALTINWPTSYTPTTGHFAVAVVYSDQGAASVPTDWTRVGSGQFGGGTEKLDIFYKVLASTDSAPSTTISGSGTNISHGAGMMIYTGVGSIGAVGTASNGTGTPMTAGAITTTADGSIVLGISGRGDNEVAGSQTFGGSATGVNERLDAGTSQGNDAQVSAADKTITTSGTSSGDLSSTTSATDPWVSVIVELKRSTPFTDARSAIASGLDSAQSEAAGWDAKVKPNIPVANVVRTSDTVCTITLQAQADYNITAQETITATIPATATSYGSSIVASPTFTVDAAAGTSLQMLRHRRSFPMSVLIH